MSSPPNPSPQSRYQRIEALFLRPAATPHAQFDALDGLRGLAVALVVLSHSSNVGLHLLPGIDLSGTGKTGVYLFFVLSAFLLTQPMIARPIEAMRDLGSWLRYALRRVLRIFPLYYTVLTVHYLVSSSGTSRVFTDMSRDEYLRHLLLQEGKGLYWTIPVEFSYYLVLPLVAALYTVVLRRNTLAVTLATALAVGAAARIWPAAEAPAKTLNLGYFLPIFLCGSYAGFLHAKIAARAARPAAARRSADLLAVLALACVALLTPALWQWLTGQMTLKSHFHREFLLFGVLWSVVVLSVLNGSGWLERAFSWKPLRFLGVISFGVYLWHIAAARAVYLGLDLPALPLAWGMASAAVAVAIVTFVCIERPFVRSEWITARLERLAGTGAGPRDPDGPRAKEQRA